MKLFTCNLTTQWFVTFLFVSWSVSFSLFGFWFCLSLSLSILDLWSSAPKFFLFLHGERKTTFEINTFCLVGNIGRYEFVQLIMSKITIVPLERYNCTIELIMKCIYNDRYNKWYLRLKSWKKVEMIAF